DVGAVVGGTCRTARHYRLKALSLLVFGISLTFCYAASTLFHAAPWHGESLSVLQRLDHMGIYLLIAGTYTPITWALLRGAWLSGTLATVWTITGLCIARVWYGGVLPLWVVPLGFLALGWRVVGWFRRAAAG